MPLLERMKAKVDSLWSELSQASSPARKETLRKEYASALEAYKRQLLLSEGTDDTTSSPRDPIIKREGFPSPFDFHDYREFLLAWLKEYKERENGTLEKLAEATELSKEYIVKALKRSRRLTPEAQRKIMRFMGLPSVEAIYSEALYQVSETDNKRVRMAALAKMTSFASFRKTHPQDYEAWRYLSHWYYVAIREMSHTPDFVADPAWIQKRLQGFIPLPEIRKALEFLEKAGFLKILPDRTVESLHKEVKCTGGLFRLALGQFHRQMLERAATSIDEVPSDLRLLLGHSIAIPKNRQEELFEILNETITRVKALASNGESEEEVYHVEVTAFPLTQLNQKTR